MIVQVRLLSSTAVQCLSLSLHCSLRKLMRNLWCPVVQVSPDADDAGESLCSLNFAARVNGVQLGATRVRRPLMSIYQVHGHPSLTGLQKPVSPPR
jgi:hypothetical protein